MFRPDEEIILERNKKINIISRNNYMATVILYILVFSIFFGVSYFI